MINNPRGGEKIEFAPHEAQRYNIRTDAERSNVRLKDEFGARDVRVRGTAKVKSHTIGGEGTVHAKNRTSPAFALDPR